MSEAERQQPTLGVEGDHSGRSLGEQLRLKRREKGMEIQDIAHHLKLDPALLLAFEEERDPPHGLPEVYCKGFLRSYARYLGVEIQPGQIKSCRVSELQSEPVASSYTQRRSLLPFILIALVVLVWLVTGGDLNGYQKLLTGGGGEPEKTEVIAEKPAETLKSNSTTTAQDSETVTPEPATALDPEASPPALVEPEEGTVEAQPSAESEEQKEREQPAVAEPAVDEATPEVPAEPASAAPPTRGTVTIRYIDSSWTQVTDGLGRVLVKRTLDAGAVEDFEGPLPLQINLGNAIGVRVQFNGELFDHLNYIDDNNIAQFVLGGEE